MSQPFLLIQHFDSMPHLMHVMSNYVWYVVVAIAVDQQTALNTVSSESHTVNIKDQQYGYIAIHLYFSRYRYQRNHNWTLTLTGLQSNMVEVTFEYLNIQVMKEGECIDYLSITSLDNICGNTIPDPIVVTTHSKQLSFNLVTANSTAAHGVTGRFFLAYKGTV